MRIVVAVTILLASYSIEAQSQRPDLNALLATRITRFHLDATNLVEAASQMSSQFDIPMGIAWKGGLAGGKHISGEWADSTVGGLLKEMIAQDPSYEFTISNGVVHIRPAGYENDPSSFLNIRLPSFSADDYTHIVGMKLRDHLNAMLVPRPARVAGEACGGSVGIGAHEVRTTITVVNTPVEQILDFLLLNSKYQMWLVVFDPSKTYNGYFGTTSIYRKTSDSDQPNWDFLARYYDPLEGKERRDWAMTRESVGSTK